MFLNRTKQEAAAEIMAYRKAMRQATEMTEKKKREDDRRRREKNEEEKDREVIDKRKKKKPPSKKKPTRAEEATKKRLEKAAEVASMEEVRERETEEIRKKLIANGVTPRKLEDDESSDEEDDNWEDDDWRVVDHAVDLVTAKPNFKVVIGKRSNGADKWMWGQRRSLLLDGTDEGTMDEYIRSKCKQEVYREVLVLKTGAGKKRKAATEVASVVPMKVERRTTPCDHGSYAQGLSYGQEITASWCGEGYYLFGVCCAGCGSPFLDEGGTKEKGGPTTPSINNPVYCCINIAGRLGGATTEEECRHAVCSHCWNEGVIAAEDGPRLSRRTRK
jgi:hypothetical protein